MLVHGEVISSIEEGSTLRGGTSYKLEPSSFQNSLSHPGVFALHQDNLGRVWIGTQSGLNLSIGLSAVLPSRHSPGLREIAEGSILSISSNATGEEILIGTSNGLFSYFPHLETSIQWRGLPAGTGVFEIQKTEDSLLIGTQYGLFTGDFAQRKLNAVATTHGSAIRCLHVGSYKTTYICTEDELFGFDGESLVKVTSLTGKQIISVKETRDGLIAISKRNGVFFLSDDYEIKSYISHGSLEAGTLPGQEIHSSLFASNETVWLGTDNGLAIIRDSKISFTSEGSQLTHPLVTSFLECRGGEIWIGTFSGLMSSHVEANSFLHVNADSTDDVVGNSIITFYESETGEVWISSLEGLASWDPNLPHFSVQDFETTEFAGVKISSIDALNNELLFGTMRNGIFKRETRKNAYSFSSLIGGSPFRVTKVKALPPDHVLVATLYNGVFLIDSRTDSVLYRTEPMIPDLEGITDLAVSDHTAWYGSWYGNLTRLDTIELATTTWDLNNAVDQKSTPIQISSLQATEDTVWVGTTNEGLIKFNPNTEEMKVYDNLASKLIYAVEIDNGGLIWVSTSKGLSSLNPSTEEVNTYTSNHGLQGDDFNSGASIKLSNGYLLFGGNNGFNAFNPRDIKLNEHKGHTLITSFSKMNEPLPRRFLSDGSEAVELDYTENVFGFEFALTDYVSARDNTFEYQLVGFDEDWVESGTKNTATYTNLSAGEYLFQVRGTNNDGLTTDKWGYLKVTIAPPPWLTWYAFVAYGVFALALILFFFRLYAKRVERLTIEKRNAEEKEQLEALVAERTEALNEKLGELSRALRQKEIANKEIHHRVKNNLQVILGLLTLQAESHENELFQNAMDEIRQRITSMSLIHKSLYENNVDSIDFRQYTENLVGSIREFHPDLASGNIDVLLDVDTEILDIDTALPVGLILSELITNSIKHGFKGRSAADTLNMIRIAFKRIDENFILEVIDNGAGLPDDFDVNSPTSMGSELTLIFSQQLSGELSAEALPSGGAAFKFEFPVPEASVEN
jgi:two-component sensor histidine kinase/ligand-binding sensor domain-containing protein